MINDLPSNAEAFDELNIGCLDPVVKDYVFSSFFIARLLNRTMDERNELAKENARLKAQLAELTELREKFNELKTVMDNLGEMPAVESNISISDISLEQKDEFADMGFMERNCETLKSLAGEDNASDGLESDAIEPMSEEAPVAIEESVLEETPIAIEEPVLEETPIAIEEPVLEETPIAIEEPVLGEAPVAIEEPIMEDTPLTIEEPLTIDETTLEVDDSLLADLDKLTQEVDMSVTESVDDLVAMLENPMEGTEATTEEMADLAALLEKMDVPEIPTEAAPEPAPEPVVEATPEPVAEPVPESVPEPVVEAAPESVPEPVVEAAPAPVPEPVVEAAPAPAPEPAPAPAVDIPSDPNAKLTPEQIAALFAGV